MRRTLGATAAAALAACVTPTAWRPSAGTIHSSEGFSVTLPAGWMVLAQEATQAQGAFAASRDGPGLQCIAAGVIEAGPGTSPALGALAVWQRLPLYASAGSGQGTSFVVASTLGGEATPPEVVTSTEGALWGLPAVREELAWTDPRGLPVRAVVRGTTLGQRLYWILYVAPARHYFDLDLATFEEVARSFRIEPVQKPAPAPGPSP